MTTKAKDDKKNLKTSDKKSTTVKVYREKSAPKKTIAELAEEQGVKPFDPSENGKNWPEGADFEEFYNAIQKAAENMEGNMASNPESEIMLMIDTNVFSYIFKRTQEEHKFTPLKYGIKTCISFVTIGEAYFGARKAKWGARMINELKTELARYIVLYPDYDLCLLYGDLKARCLLKGCPIDESDYWIAACARYFDIPLMTNNLKHFKNIEGLKVISSEHIN